VVEPFRRLLVGAPVSGELLLGLDVGTTGVKAVLVDTDLQPLASATRRIPTEHPRPGWVEQSGQDVVTASVDSVAEVLSKAQGDVVACGLDHQGESVIAWDAETGAPLSPNVVWQDKRPMDLLERLKAAGLEEEIKARSGLPLDPYFSAGKLTWMLENLPDVQAARERGTLRLGTLDAFLCDHLGAGFATDPSTASRMQLYSFGATDWDPWLCETFGVLPESLPRIEDTVGELGTLRHPSWDRELPLRARLVDQQAALAGTGCVLPGMVKATYGTGVFVFAHAGTTVPEAGELLPTVAWRIGGVTEYALDGGVFAAGALLEWMSHKLGLAEDPQALAALARDVDDSGGVRVLPAIAGIGAPWWRPEARGVIAGLTAASGRPEVARAALEGIAWRVADVFEAVAERVTAKTLRVDGGLTNDPLLVSLQADAIGVTVEQVTADATSLGAALLAGVGAEVFPSIADTADLVPIAKRVSPQRDDAWRSVARTQWRQFVERAAEL
jgi:glycerol kinase